MVVEYLKNILGINRLIKMTYNMSITTTTLAPGLNLQNQPVIGLKP